MKDATAASEDPKRDGHAGTNADEDPRDSAGEIDETPEEECLMKDTVGEKMTMAEMHEENQDGPIDEKTVTKVSANHHKATKNHQVEKLPNRDDSAPGTQPDGKILFSS